MVMILWFPPESHKIQNIAIHDTIVLQYPPRTEIADSDGETRPEDFLQSSLDEHSSQFRVEMILLESLGFFASNEFLVGQSSKDTF